MLHCIRGSCLLNHYGVVHLHAMMKPFYPEGIGLHDGSSPHGHEKLKNPWEIFYQYLQDLQHHRQAPII